MRISLPTCSALGRHLTSWAKALRFSGKDFSNFCFVGSYMPTNIAEALQNKRDTSINCMPPNTKIVNNQDDTQC